jgi:ABC-type ATPase involved in cell division
MRYHLNLRPEGRGEDDHVNRPPALKISGLEFRYSPDGPPLASVGSFEVAAGEQVLLTGGSGAGKSTLLQLIAGLLEPGAGSVEIAGTNIHALRGAARDRFRGGHLGFIFQTFNLLHGFSALENVMAALKFSSMPAGQHGARAAELLRHLGIDRPDADPDRMSVGQQQRVAVARAVAASPGAGARRRAHREPGSGQRHGRDQSHQGRVQGVRGGIGLREPRPRDGRTVREAHPPRRAGGQPRLTRTARRTFPA